MKFVFFGTPLFAARLLEALIADGLVPIAVVTRSDKPKGRSGTPVPSAVKNVALAHGLPLLQPEKAGDPAFIAAIAAMKPGLMVVAVYGQILKAALLDVAPAINVHPSLLPHLRGCSPIQSALMRGDRTTGVTIQKMALGMDEGDILKQVPFAIPDDMDAGQLSEALLQLAIPLLIDVVRQRPEGIAQDHTKATYTKKIELEDAELKWEQPAQELHNKVRGCTPVPGAWCWVEIRGKRLRLKVLKTFLSQAVGVPGQILEWGKKGIVVACKEGALSMQVVQLEGKTPVLAAALVAGYPQQAILFSL